MSTQKQPVIVQFWLLTLITHNYGKLYRKDVVLLAVHTFGASPQSSASHLLTFLVAQLQFLREWKLSDRRLYEVFERRLLIWGNPKERNRRQINASPGICIYIYMYIYILPSDLNTALSYHDVFTQKISFFFPLISAGCTARSTLLQVDIILSDNCRWPRLVGPFNS